MAGKKANISYTLRNSTHSVYIANKERSPIGPCEGEIVSDRMASYLAKARRKVMRLVS